MLTAKQFLVFTVGTLVLNSLLYAEVVTDGTIGLGKTLKGPDYKIDANLGEIQRGNWFHSFRDFNIGTGESATFSHEPVTNIIARVTGGNPSSIYGSLHADANLYLLNPSGILFGQGAIVDVNGSFHASTADYIRLTDGTIFSAQPNPNQLLSVAPVEAFGFLSNRPATIEVKEGSVLKVSEGKDLSIIGGDLTIQDSSLQAPGGGINLISVASNGEVIPSSSDWVKNFEKLGKITLSQSPWSPETPAPPANLDVSGPAGQIFIRAGELFSSNASVFADTYQGDKGGLIDISVEGPISLTHSTVMTADNSIQTSPESQEKSGIIINAKGPLFLGLTEEDLKIKPPLFTTADLELTAARTPEQIQSITKSYPKARNLIEAGIFSRIGILSSCVTPDCGNRTRGNISITTPILKVSYGAIEAATKTGSGNAGNIQINASQVNLHDYGYINASVGKESFGHAGNIFLRDIDGVNPASKISLSNYSSISASVSASSIPDKQRYAGGVDLKTQELVLTKVGQINSFSYGKGNAGLIKIETDTALLTDDSGIYTKANLASGGNITLHVRDWLVLFNSKITAESRGNEPGDNGGNLTISNLKILALEKSALFTSAKRGYGGDITVPENTISLGKIEIIERSTFAGQELDLDALEVERDKVVKDLIETRGYSVIDSTSLVKGKDGILRLPRLQWKFKGFQVLPPEPPKPPPLRGRCSLSKDRFTITARDVLPRCPEDLRTHTIRLGNYY